MLPPDLQIYNEEGTHIDEIIKYLDDNQLSYYYLYNFKGDIPEEYQLKMVNEKAEYVLFLNNPSEKAMLEAVRKNWRLIGSMPFPSRRVQAEAVRQSPEAEKLIVDADVVVDIMRL